MITTYIIGGVPRSGKSYLRKRLLEKYKIAGISLDILRDGFTYGMPELGIVEDMNQSEEERSKILWPYFKGILTTRSFYNDKFVFEGTNILPELLDEIKNKSYIKIVFFGYPNVDPNEKLQLIRKFESEDCEWTKELTDEKVLNGIQKWMASSKQLQEDCKKHDMKFIDTSHDFEKGIEEGERYLLN